MAKFLVTGGAGFIGSHLVNKLIEKGGDVSILDNFHHNQKIEELFYKDNVEIIRGDVRDANLINAITKNVDIIFHLAAISNIRESIENPEQCFHTNTVGTFNILNAALRNNVKKIIFSSSREVYGNAKKFPVSEEEPVNPINIYGATKASAEYLCNIFRKEHGLKITVFRLSNVYGEGDMGKSRVIPSFIRKLNNNESLIVNGGDQIADFVWIDDVVSLFIDSITKYDNQTLNIGSGKGVSINELAELMIHLSGKNVEVIHSTTIPQEVEKYVSDISKIGITPLPLEKGLKILLNV